MLPTLFLLQQLHYIKADNSKRQQYRNYLTYKLLSEQKNSFIIPKNGNWEKPTNT